jgi:hypothetical protein
MSVTHKVRTVFYLGRKERDELEKLSAKTGAPIAELLRRAVTEWLNKQRKER